MEEDLIDWLGDVAGVPVHFQHLNRKPPDEFVWFIRNGDESADTMDAAGEEPDTVYFDVECYSSSPTRSLEMAAALRSQRDYRGPLGLGWVEDVDFSDQRDDYEPQANADSLPPYAVSFRMAVTGYESDQD